jgi:hypothetical protein
MVDVIMMGEVMFTTLLHRLATIATTTTGTTIVAQLLPLSNPLETLKWRFGSSMQSNIHHLLHVIAMVVMLTRRMGGKKIHLYKVCEAKFGS